MCSEERKKNVVLLSTKREDHGRAINFFFFFNITLEIVVVCVRACTLIIHVTSLLFGLSFLFYYSILFIVAFEPLSFHFCYYGKM